MTGRSQLMASFDNIPVDSSQGELIALVDAHVHYYACFGLSEYFQGAEQNFARIAGQSERWPSGARGVFVGEEP